MKMKIKFVSLILCLFLFLLSTYSTLRVRKFKLKKNIETLKGISEDKIYRNNLEKFLKKPENKTKLETYFEKKVLTLTDDKKEKKRIKNLTDHWNKNEKNNQDAMGGNAKLRKIDETAINKTLSELEKEGLIHPKTDYIIEFGAGLGRITKNVFIKKFNKIDVLEPAPKLAESLNKLKNKHPSIKSVYVKKGEELNFVRKYNIIFSEFVLENITDTEVIRFLIRIRNNLEPKGVVIFRENVSSEVSETDITYTQNLQKIRNLKFLEFLFKITGFKIKKNRNTENWPTNYLALKEFILTAK